MVSGQSVASSWVSLTLGRGTEDGFRRVEVCMARFELWCLLAGDVWSEEIHDAPVEIHAAPCLE
jgi:hypothetical protein